MRGYLAGKVKEQSSRQAASQLPVWLASSLHMALVLPASASGTNHCLTS
jgi:hypothetical protein